MRDVEKNVCCVLLEILAQKNLIPQKTCEKARESFFGTLDKGKFFCYCDEKTKEE